MAVQFVSEPVNTMTAKVMGDANGNYVETGTSYEKKLSFKLENVKSGITATQAETVFNSFIGLVGAQFIDLSIVDSGAKRTEEEE